MGRHDTIFGVVADTICFPTKPPVIEQGRRPTLNSPADQSLPLPILIVDDHAQQLALCKLMLRKLPHPILTALNAEQALVLLNEHIPALIILDVAMPGISGVELLQLLRSNQRYQTTKIIMATAVANLVPLSDRRLADRVLTKPFAYHDLRQAINELLNQ